MGPVPLVPHLHSSYAALRLPNVHQPKLRFPLLSAYRVAGVFFLAGYLRAPAKRRTVGDSGMAPRWPSHHSETLGPPRLLGRPLHTCRRQTPRPDPLRPTRRIASVPPSATLRASTSGELAISGLNPPAHMLARLRIASAVVATGARLATDLLGYALVGSVSHRLDDVLDFKESSSPPIPPGQRCLVAP